MRRSARKWPAGARWVLVGCVAAVACERSTAPLPRPGPAKLSLVSQPVTAMVGDTIGPVVTVAIGANPGGGTLSGTRTRHAVNGVATVGDLTIEPGGTGYTLTAVSGALQGATSRAFTIAPGACAGCWDY